MFYFGKFVLFAVCVSFFHVWSLSLDYILLISARILVPLINLTIALVICTIDFLVKRWYWSIIFIKQGYIKHYVDIINTEALWTSLQCDWLIGSSYLIEETKCLQFDSRLLHLQCDMCCWWDRTCLITRSTWFWSRILVVWVHIYHGHDFCICTVLYPIS